MKKIKLLLVLIILFISISAVSAEGNFTALQNEISTSTDSIDITQDYTYDNSTDDDLNGGIVINRTGFTINGNGHTIDGSNQARILYIDGENITISNLKLINGFIGKKAGGAICSQATITLNNITFENNYAEFGGAVYVSNISQIIDCHFDNNNAIYGGAINYDDTLTAINSEFKNSNKTTFSMVYSNAESELNIERCRFLDSAAKYATAIYAQNNVTIRNSIFRNLNANETGGAVALKDLRKATLENCTFTDTRAEKNGGALFIDINKDSSNQSYVKISDSAFINSYGDFGGALVQLGGNLEISNSEFINNKALYSGGAIYISNVDNGIITNSNFENNKLIIGEMFNGGGIYSDYSILTVSNSNFTKNTKNGIYAYDRNLTVEDSTFLDNGEAIHGVFLNYNIKRTIINNDTLLLNDTDFEYVVMERSIEIPINNTIDVDTLPSRYDSRDWGWTSPVRDQGEMGACWTFGTLGALESALLKATGITYDFSENNMQNTMLKYSKYGNINNKEGGIRELGLLYIVSWLGVIPQEYDTYDELGKLSPLIATDENIRIQDVITVDPRKNSTDNDAFKKAILECGAATTGYYANETCYNNKTFAYYQTTMNITNHAVCFVGWDDNYPASNFLITPPGNGAWIVKNSWGTDWGDKGYFYLSYYDPSLLNTTFAIAFNIDNIVNYTKNYQTDFGGELDTYTSKPKPGDNITAANIYESIGIDSISAVGSYFDDDEHYKIEIFVNRALRHTQTGIAAYTGYHTIILEDEIAIKEGDVFEVRLTKPTIKVVGNSRHNYEANTSFISGGNGWTDLSSRGETACIKVYTTDLNIYTQDLVKIYKNASKFEANIGVANETVTFEINGGTYTRISDENGTAKMAINLNPGNYTIKTTYNGASVENNIEVLPTLIAQDLVKYYRNASQFYVSLIDGEGNPVKNTEIRMNINGVFYDRTTNENGTARLNINLNPGEYILTAIDPLTGLQMSYTITVLPTLNASDLEMSYKDGSSFNVLVLDGQGNPLANAAVTFNINGVFYTRYANSSGIAKLNINLMSGKYIITSEYDELRISNTITIK